MRTAANTLFVMTQGAYVGRNHLSLTVRVEGKESLRVPIHHLQSIVCFGRVTVSPAVYETCAEHRVLVSFLTATGRFLGSLDTIAPGSARLRRAQYSLSADREASLAIARPMVAAKIQNSRQLLLRGAREQSSAEAAESLRPAATSLASLIQELPGAPGLDQLRGLEGLAARIYFDAFNGMLRRRSLVAVADAAVGIEAARDVSHGRPVKRVAGRLGEVEILEAPRIAVTA